MSNLLLSKGEDSICIGCGLCCDGTVVTHLAVRDESDLGLPLQTLGVEIIFASDPPVFALPCPAVCDGVCTIHALHRPSACAQYECSISRGLANGYTTRTQARKLIDQTFEMKKALRDGAITTRAFEDHIDAVFRAG